jgi:hypothetical protein
MARITHTIPPDFGPDFLEWFRERTEATWAAITPRTPEEILASYATAGVGGAEWQHGTRWLHGLGDDEIAQVERRWRLTFPPDERLFLQHLHAPDRPMLHACYRSLGALSHAAPRPLATAYAARSKQCMVLKEDPSLFNWLTNTKALEDGFAWLWEGIQFDVEHSTLWPASWGEKPAVLEAQQRRVRELVEAAPRLIPFLGHRYLLAEPCAPGNPVLSVYQSDIIIYGADLRDYLLVEFADILGLGADEKQIVEYAARERLAARYSDYQTIPFWGKFL